MYNSNWSDFYSPGDGRGKIPHCIPCYVMFFAIFMTFVLLYPW